MTGDRPMYERGTRHGTSSVDAASDLKAMKSLLRPVKSLKSNVKSVVGKSVRHQITYYRLFIDTHFAPRLVIVQLSSFFKKLLTQSLIVLRN